MSSSLNYHNPDSGVPWKYEYAAHAEGNAQPDNRYYQDYPMFRPPTPSYNSPPHYEEGNNHYEAPEWQTLSDHAEPAPSELPTSEPGSYFQWPYDMQRNMSSHSISHTSPYPQTPFEHLSDRDERYDFVTVSPGRLSEASRGSVASIDYPLPPVADSSLTQSHYYMALNAPPLPPLNTSHHASDSSSAIVDSEYSVNVSDFQRSTKQQLPTFINEDPMGPLTVVHNGDDSLVLPGIVRDDPSKQNITYWIPLDPLTPARHACISKEAHLRGLHLSSIASMLNLFSNQDGADRCPWKSVSAEAPECPLLEIDLFESRDGANEEEPRKIKGKEKIKRPLNSFMIYRRSQTKRAMVNARKLSMKLDHKTISSVIGLLWQTERAAVQDHFIQLSTIEKSRHQMLFPGYRFQPRRKSRGESMNHRAKDLR